MWVDRDKYSDRYKDHETGDGFDDALETGTRSPIWPDQSIDNSDRRIQWFEDNAVNDALADTSAELADLKLEATAMNVGYHSLEKAAQWVPVESGWETKQHLQSSVAGRSPPGGINGNNLADGIVPQDPQIWRAQAAAKVQELIDDFSRDKLSLV